MCVCVQLLAKQRLVQCIVLDKRHGGLVWDGTEMTINKNTVVHMYKLQVMERKPVNPYDTVVVTKRNEVDRYIDTSTEPDPRWRKLYYESGGVLKLSQYGSDVRILLKKGTRMMPGMQLFLDDQENMKTHRKKRKIGEMTQE